MRDDDGQLVKEVKRTLRSLSVSLPAKQIIVDVEGSGLDEDTVVPSFGYFMVVLAVIGAIPNDQIAHSVFNASTQNGRLLPTFISPISVSVLAAEDDLKHWCSAYESKAVGAVGN
ncbi:MAG: hypothetical protein AAGB04_14435 [Pseudomonadota bacterium]